MPKANKAKTATPTSSSMNLPDLNGLTAVVIVAGVAGATYALVEAVRGAQKNMSDLGAFTAEQLFGTKEEKELLVKLKNDLATPDTPSWVATLFHERMQFDPVASLTISYLWEKEGIDWQGIATDWERYMINDRAFARSVVLAYRYLYGGELIMMLNDKSQSSGRNYFRKRFPECSHFLGPLLLPRARYWQQQQ
jgi:hypothetical protein